MMWLNVSVLTLGLGAILVARGPIARVAGDFFSSMMTEPPADTASAPDAASVDPSTPRGASIGFVDAPSPAGTPADGSGASSPAIGEAGLRVLLATRTAVIVARDAARAAEETSPDE